MRNLQEKGKKAFFYQKLFSPFTIWTNCSSDLKIFANSRPSASNFKSFSRSLGEQFILTVGQNNTIGMLCKYIAGKIYLVHCYKPEAISYYCHSPIHTFTIFFKYALFLLAHTKFSLSHISKICRLVSHEFVGINLQ